MSIGRIIHIDDLSGAECPRDTCSGELYCYCSKQKAGSMVRYYRCNKCACRPADNVRAVKIEHSLRRIPSKKV